MSQVDVEQRHAENRAVGGNQRQENTEQAIQRRAGFAHHHFRKLHHKGNHQDKSQRAQIGQAERDQYPGINPPGAN
ncbi:hypothetical protein D3C86_2066360 [compost metagenome]